MPLWKSILSGIVGASLASCSAAPDAMSIKSASIAASTLSAQIDWHPNADILDALDHGIPLDFLVTVRAQTAGTFGWHTRVAEQRRHLELRFYPLSRYYQLRDVDRNQTQSFSARASAIAAIEDLRVALPDWNATTADRYQLDIAIDRTALPGVLRISSLVRPAWWLDSGTFTWPAGAN